MYIINVYTLDTCSIRRGAVGCTSDSWRSLVRAPSKAPVVSLSKKCFHYCLVLVGSRNGFGCDFTIELNKLRALWKSDLNIK